MTTAIATTTTDALALTDETVDKARQLIHDGTPANTLRARESALRYFWAWAAEALDLAECYPVSGDVLLRFATDHLTDLGDDIDAALVAAGSKAKLGTHSAATVQARVSHIGAAHRVQGLDSPAEDPRVVELLKAARKIRARRGGQDAKQAATLPILNQLVATCDLSAAGLRDQALLLVAFASGGRRRSEVAAATFEDLEIVDTVTGSAFVLTIHHSKADQEGAGLQVPITGRAADALTRWLSHAGITSGPIFRRIRRGGHVMANGLAGQAVWIILKRRAELAGLDPAAFGAHSLRSGFMTTAGQAGVPMPEAMALSGHGAAASALRYYQSGDALNNQAAGLAG